MGRDVCSREEEQQILPMLQRALSRHYFQYHNQVEHKIKTKYTKRRQICANLGLGPVP